MGCGGLTSPGCLSFPQSYFLSQAQSLCSSERSAIPDSLRWLCHPLGQKFFVERSWTVKSAAKESLYCTQRNPGESCFCSGRGAACTLPWEPPLLCFLAPKLVS